MSSIWLFTLLLLLLFYRTPQGSLYPARRAIKEYELWADERRWKEGEGGGGGSGVTGPCHWRALSIGPFASQDPVTVAIEAPEWQMAAVAQRRSLAALNVSITATYIKSLKDKRWWRETRSEVDSRGEINKCCNDLKNEIIKTRGEYFCVHEWAGKGVSWLGCAASLTRVTNANMHTGEVT